MKVQGPLGDPGLRVDPEPEVNAFMDVRNGQETSHRPGIGASTYMRKGEVDESG